MHPILFYFPQAISVSGSTGVVTNPVLCYDTSYCDIFSSNLALYSGSGSGSGAEGPQWMDILHCCANNPTYSSTALVNGTKTCLSCYAVRCYQSSNLCEGDDHVELPGDAAPNECCSGNSSVLVRVAGSKVDFACISCYWHCKYIVTRQVFLYL